MPPKMPSPHTPSISHHFAVIGAGASGLVAARELRREGHQVVVFEKDDQIGGTWVYTPRVEPDLLGVDSTRPIIHSSLYESLRTNLPRESMGFLDYPFVTREGEGRDPRRFPSHREVLMYLQEFAKEFGIEKMVRFGCEVVCVELAGNGKWKVEIKRKKLDGDGDNGFLNEVYDAVVVCNGHFTQPRIAQIPGIDLWPGKQIHSHNYRTPELFSDRVIILIGNSFTAADLSIEIAGVAKEVHIASRSVADETHEKQAGYDNMWLHSMIERAHEDGTVVFRDGSVIHADIILHCIGYIYDFPFLKINGIVTVDDNRVGPLYKHVFPPVFAPRLSFVGLPWKAPLLPLFELQSKWVAGVLSGRIELPSQEDMMKDVDTFYSTLGASGVPKRYTHNMSYSQDDYSSWLAAQCQCPDFEKWRKQMYQETAKNRLVRPRTFRDEWEDNHLVLQALEDFSKYTSSIVGNHGLSDGIQTNNLGDIPTGITSV